MTVVALKTHPARLRAVSGSVPPAELSDDDLIEAVVAGDDGVAGHLHDHLYPVIDRTLCRVFGTRDADHEDLVQSAFEHVVNSLARGSFGRQCNLRTWAARIATHVGLNSLRARQRERRVLSRSDNVDDTSAASPQDIERQSHARGQLERVKEALAEMNPRRAEVMFLHDVEGHTLEEIGQMMGLSFAAVQSRLVRGRKELLRRFSREDTHAHLRWDVGGGS